MAYAVNVIRPPVGGGFGDMKIGIATFTGTKPDGGFPSPFDRDPILVVSDGGAASYSSGKVDVTTGSTVLFFFK